MSAFGRRVIIREPARATEGTLHGALRREYFAGEDHGTGWVPRRSEAHVFVGLRQAVVDTARELELGGDLRVVRLLGLRADRCRAASNILAGVAMHLGGIAKRLAVHDLAEPIGTISGLAAEFDLAAGYDPTDALDVAAFASDLVPKESSHG